MKADMAKHKPPQTPAAADKPESAQPAAGAGPSFPLHEHIGRQLKALFDDVAEQPVPDKFQKLIEELEQKERDSSGRNMGPAKKKDA
jgi:hypothetical protein